MWLCPVLSRHPEIAHNLPVACPWAVDFRRSSRYLKRKKTCVYAPGSIEGIPASAGQDILENIGEGSAYGVGSPVYLRGVPDCLQLECPGRALAALREGIQQHRQVGFPRFKGTSSRPASFSNGCACFFLTGLPRISSLAGQGGILAFFLKTSATLEIKPMSGP